MVRGPTSCRRLNPFKAHLSQVERLDKHVDHPNRITLVNKIIEAFGQQRRLPTIRLFYKAPHQFLRESRKNHNRGTAVFTQPGSKAEVTSQFHNTRLRSWCSAVLLTIGLA